MVAGICNQCGKTYSLDSTEDFALCSCGGEIKIANNDYLDEKQYDSDTEDIIGTENGNNLKILAPDIQFVIISSLLIFSAQFIKFFFVEVFGIGVKGLFFWAFAIVMFSFLFVLTILTQRFFNYLGYDMLSLPTDEKEYLVCIKCGSYYELLPGDKKEDFPDRCKCGARLIQSPSNNLSEKIIKIHPAKYFLIFVIGTGIILFFGIKYFNLDLDYLLHTQASYYLNFMLIFVSSIVTVSIFRILKLILSPFGIKLRIE